MFKLLTSIVLLQGVAQTSWWGADQDTDALTVTQDEINNSDMVVDRDESNEIADYDDDETVN